MLIKSKSILLSACLLVICFLITPLSVCAESEDNTASEVQSLACGIIDYKLNKSAAESVEDWVINQLPNEAGIGAEWYVIALSHCGEYDFSAYNGALEDYISQNKVYSASSRQKYALAFIVSGNIDEHYLNSVMNDSIGAQGVMSYIYGLHLLNNGYESNITDKPEVIEKLLSFALSDGGWALNGNISDIDVTAMAIQSLAPYYETDKTVKTAVDNAITLLSSRQNPQGGYSSYGVVNAESTAQVITALSCLKIDAFTDERFIKNGNTLLDELKRFRLENGGFSHAVGGNYNENATSQAFYSLVSYLLFKNDAGSLYIFDNLSVSTPDSDTSQPESVIADINSEPEPEPEPEKSNKKWAYIIAAVLGVISAVVVWICKKNLKDVFLVIGITVFSIVIISFVNIQSADEYYSAGSSSKTDAVGTVTLSITCENLVGIDDNQMIPENGIILDTESFEIGDGETVYDILIKASKTHSIHTDISGADGMYYVRGINNLYEFQYGEFSGWMFYVNGESVSVGCDACVLKNGDVVEWKYTLELGKDFE